MALAAVLVFGVGGWDWLTSPDPDIDAGNQAFDAGKFDEALGLYQRAEKTTDSEAAIRFDVGAALYRLAESEKDQDKRAQLLDRAESAFREATDTSDEILKSAAFHNLGNAMFRRQRWPQAKDAYKKALKANQDNDDARYNLELVLAKEKRDEKPASGRGPSQPKNPGKNQGQGDQQKPQGGDGASDDAADPDGRQNPQSGGAGQQTQDDQAGAGPDRSDQTQPGQGQKSGDPSAGQSQSAPNSGQGAPQDQPPGAQGPKGPQAGGGGGKADPTGADSDADSEPGEGESMSDRDRKLDALESRSRDLRRRRFRRGASGSRTREGNVKDW